MSYSSLARRVRDSGLPFRWRVSALCSYVQLYQPLGFEATQSFLESRAGSFKRDEAALLSALEVIEASRAARYAEVQVYAKRRREAKARGQRIPRPGEVNPHAQAKWY